MPLEQCITWIKTANNYWIASHNGHNLKICPKIKHDPWCRGSIDGKLFVSKRDMETAKTALEKQFFKMGFDYT